MKKQEREKEMKRKADERARKAAEKAKRDAEKAKKAQERAAERAKIAAEKAADKAKKAQGRVSTRGKRPIPSKATGESSASSGLAAVTTELEPKSKAPRLIDEDIDTEECCACFGQYADDVGTGREWLECACG